MANKKNGNERVGADPMGRAPSSPGGGGIPKAVAADIDRIIRGTCRGFARAADWRQVSHGASLEADSGPVDPGTGYRLSEDHEGLHSGRYIHVRVLPTAQAVAIKGGYYDGYWQPRTVYSESMPLREVTAQTLGCLLMEIHDRLCNGHQPQAT
jgi:hypothetical protein